MSRSRGIVVTLLVTLSLVLGAWTPSALAAPVTHYFVSPAGNDSSDGRTPRTAFATIQHALEVAQPGDTVRLMPGRYLQDVKTVRDGTPDRPITLTGPRAAIVSGAGTSSRIFEVNHSYLVFKGFTIDGLWGDPDSEEGYRDKLMYVIGTEPLAGPSGLRILDMNFVNGGGECLRIRYFAQHNEVAYSRFRNCGVHDFRFGPRDANGVPINKNGEAIYIGTSSTQYGRHGAPTADVDETNDNWIHHNFMDTQGNECVDIKEGSTRNLVEHNECTGQLDPNSGGMDARADGNVFRYNLIYGNLGAGVRLGGHLYDGVQYGKNNDVYENTIYDNQAGGIKFMVAPQGKVCGNTMYNNSGGDSVGTFRRQFDPTAPCE